MILKNNLPYNLSTWIKYHNKSLKSLKLKLHFTYKIFKMINIIDTMALNASEFLGNIKPTNILLDESGNLFLDDFGISKVHFKKGLADGFTSPEILKGKEGSKYSDSWSLGMIMIFILFNGEIEDV